MSDQPVLCMFSVEAFHLHPLYFSITGYIIPYFQIEVTQVEITGCLIDGAGLLKSYLSFSSLAVRKT